MHIIIFFTYNVSLKDWHESGLIDRELLLYKKYLNAGYEITLFTYGGKDDLKFNTRLGDIKIFPAYIKIRKHKSKIFRLLHTFFFPILYRDLFKSGDIYKTNQMYGSWVPSMGKILYRKKLVIRCGFEYFRNLLREYPFSLKASIYFLCAFILELFSYNLANKIIISNKTDIEFIKKWIRIPSSKITLIRNFIDTEIFRPTKKNGSSRLPDNRLLFVGRLEHQKNLKNLLRAVKMTKIHLDIVGEGHQKMELENRVENLKLDVNFMGSFQNNLLPKLINNYSFFILPSFYENNPKSLLEAMACGKIVIASNVEGIKEIITDGKNGLLCSPQPASMKNVIKKALALNMNERKRMSMNARTHILKEYSLDAVYKKERSTICY